MSEFVAKNLANGQAPNVKTAIYTVPVGRSAIVRSVTLVNTHTSAVTVNLTANFGSGSRLFAPKSLSLSPNYFYEHDVGLTLGSGNQLEIEASVSNVVDFIVSGVEDQ